MPQDRPLTVIAGMAEGLGASLAGAFAAAGCDVLGLARSDRAARAAEERAVASGGSYRHVTADISAPEAAEALRPHADRIAVLIHTAQVFSMKPFAETAPEDFEQAWRASCLGAANLARVTAPAMAANGQGAILLTGATASIRGGARFSAFAAAKFALRGFAQSLAREYGPKGVHVAHVLLDGLIEEPQSDARFGPGEGRMSAQAVAKAYVDLWRQEPSAWTHELDLRPAGERF